MHQFINRLWLRSLIGIPLLVGAICTKVAVAQSESTEQSPLVDDLLDLLTEPQPTSKENVPSPKLTPSDVGLAGEDLGEQSENPLEAVRQSMLIAAGYLERGVTDSETQTLQSDIVQRLDDLIAQLEQPENQQDQQESEQQQQQSSGQEEQQNENAQFSKPQQSGPAPEPEDGQDVQVGAGNPGRQGVAEKRAVELSDPRVLQQNVWGQLPEQVRKQMQSRMVERFLPSYRQQIEAYFQALLKDRN